MALIVYKPELDMWRPGNHTGTFRGNQLAFYTGAYVLRHLRSNNYAERVMHKGEYFLLKLNSLKDSHPQFIAEVRGLGLMLGLQIGMNGVHLGSVAKQIQNAMYETHSIILECGGRDGSVLRFLTSLDFSIAEIDLVISSLHSVLESLTEKLQSGQPSATRPIF